MKINDWFFWSGFAFIVVGLVAGFLHDRKLAAPLYAIGLTLAGVSAFLHSLHVKDVVPGSLCFLLAVAVIVLDKVEDLKEREKDAREEVEQGQVHGEGAEGARD